MAVLMAAVGALGAYGVVPGEVLGAGWVLFGLGVGLRPYWARLWSHWGRYVMARRRNRMLDGIYFHFDEGINRAFFNVGFGIVQSLDGAVPKEKLVARLANVYRNLIQVLADSFVEEATQSVEQIAEKVIADLERRGHVRLEERGRAHRR